MMRQTPKWLPILSVIIFLFAVATSTNQTYAATVSGFDSGFQVQNLSSSSAANIVVTYYDSAGNVAETVNDSIPASSSAGYYPLPVTAGFTGAAVISSDQPIAAITNVLAESGSLRSSYSGFTSGGNTLSLPVVMKDNFGIDTFVSVQNSGSSDTTITIAYAGTSCTDSATISPGQAHVFDQSADTCLPATRYVNAATVTTDEATDSIVGTVIQTTPSFGLYAYNGFTSNGPTLPVLPIVLANNFGLQSAIQIQNQSTTQASDVTVTYTPTIAGTACSETRTINAGESSTFTLFAFTFNSQTTSTTCTFGERFVGSAQVTANSNSVPLVGIVNQTDYAAKGSSYNSLSPDAGTSTVVFPQIIDAFGFFSGYSVVNVGSDSTTVTCDYSSDDNKTENQTLAPGAAMTVVVLNYGLDSNVSGGYNGSVTCTAAGGTDNSIVGVNNVNTASTSKDEFTTYEATNN